MKQKKDKEDFSTFKKERQEFKEGKRVDINEIQVNETIEFAILEDGYKPKESDIKDMAKEIGSLKRQIDMYDDLCDEIEEELEKSRQHHKEQIEAIQKKIEKMNEFECSRCRDVGNGGGCYNEPSGHIQELLQALKKSIVEDDKELKDKTLKQKERKR